MLTEQAQTDPKAIAEAAGLPTVVGEYAARIVEQLEANNYEFPNDDRTYSAAVYLAARDEDEPITADEIAAVSGVGEAAIRREYKKLKKVRGIVTTPGDPEDYIRRYGDELGFAEEETVAFALDLYADAVEEGVAVTNRTPGVTAGMCLYAANLYTEEIPDLTLSAFEDFGVSGVAVRLAYKELFALRGGDPKEKSERMTSHEDTKQIDGFIDDLHAEIPNVPEVVYERARELADEVRSEEWVLGKIPESVAAACYWLAAREYRVQISQKEIADVIGTHKVTVSRRVQEMREEQNLAGAESDAPA